MSSRPTSPIKQTFKKLLSPSKQKSSPALTSTHHPPDHTNWTYPDSTSSSSGSSFSATEYSATVTGWNVIDRPQTPTLPQTTTDANKENQHFSPQEIVHKVMGPSTPPKSPKRNAKPKSHRKTNNSQGDLDRQFEELMVIPL
jgi:hypothetical protein